MGSSVGVMQTLPFPGKRNLASAVAEREIEIERAKLAVMETRLRTDVLSAAYRQILYYRLLDLNDRAREALRQARSKADLVVVQVHWGTEWSPLPDASQRRSITKLSNTRSIVDSTAHASRIG